jgi:ABC-type amino acid transport substrate-binding protein/predicted enzyme related to lactoylglutathione lyase
MPLLTPMSLHMKSRDAISATAVRLGRLAVIFGTCLLAGTAPAQEPATPSPALRVGVSPIFPPMVSKQGKQLVGAEVDLAQAFGKSVGRDVVFVELPWEDQLDTLIAGKIDIVMSSMSVTLPRRYVVDFTQPYLTIGQMALVRREDLNLYILGFPSKPPGTIGVLKATTGEFLVEREFPKSRRKIVKSGAEAVQALKKNKIALFIGDSTMVCYLAGMHATDGIAVVPLFLTEEQLGWAVRKGNPSLLNSANAFIREAGRDGTLEGVFRRWMAVPTRELIAHIASSSYRNHASNCTPPRIEGDFTHRTRILLMKSIQRLTFQLMAVFFGCWISTHAAEQPKLPPLTTEPGAARLKGKFVWADLVTHDVPAARKFYQELLGWTFRDYGGYWIGSNDERPLCGLVQRPRPPGSEAQPRWIGFISVNNVERASRIVGERGGRVLAAPRKFPKRGEQAVFSDPQGAAFGVVRSGAGDPADFLADPGDWVWIQLLCRDARKAGDFYRELAGYEMLENTDTSRPNDFVLSSDGFARAAILTIPDGHEKLQPTWLLFVRVASTSESIANVKRLGGRVLISPNSSLFGGRVAVVADPTGAAIGLIELSQENLEGAVSP